jgi:hypothetical protein
LHTVLQPSGKIGNKRAGCRKVALPHTVARHQFAIGTHGDKCPGIAVLWVAVSHEPLMGSDIAQYFINLNPLACKVMH